MISPTFALANEHSNLRTSGDLVAAVGRVLLAAIFIFFGAGKAADPAGTIGYIGSVGLPFPSLAYAGAVALEAGGGLAMLWDIGRASWRSRWRCSRSRRR